MSTDAKAADNAAKLDFNCLSDGCTGVVAFGLDNVADPEFQAVCPVCHRAYALDEGLRDKLTRMMKLISHLRDCEDILGNSAVSVSVAGGEVKIPYALLLTRLNTMITLEIAGRKIDFHLWVKPSNSQVFR